MIKMYWYLIKKSCLNYYFKLILLLVKVHIILYKSSKALRKPYSSRLLLGLPSVSDNTNCYNSPFPFLPFFEFHKRNSNIMAGKLLWGVPKLIQDQKEVKISLSHRLWGNATKVLLKCVYNF